MMRLHIYIKLLILSFFFANSCIGQDTPIWDTEIPASEDFTASNGFWNDDGTRVYFQHDNLSNPNNLIVDEIWFYDFTTKERGKVFSDFAFNADVNIDESKFIYHKARIPEYLYKYDTKENTAKQITGTDSTNNFENTTLGRYSPDYSKIMTTIIAGNPRGIAIMDTNGTNAELVVDFGIMGGWFPDGEKIIYVNWVENATSKNAKQIFEANIDGTGARKLTNISDTRILAGPVVSPDGNKIAFGNNAGDGNSEIFLLEYDTGKITQVTKGEGFAESFAWSPDGKKILFDRVIPNISKRLYLIDVTTLEIEPLFKK